EWKQTQRLADRHILAIQKKGGSPFDGEYDLALLGDFQVENAAVSIAATAGLAESGHEWATPDAIRYALGNVSWPGRMEILKADIPLVVDCAHNPYSVEKLIESLKSWFPDKKWILIFGASNDKDIDGMLRALLPISEHIIVTRSYHPRAAVPYDLADKCADMGQGAAISLDPEQALELAFKQLQPDMGIIATGSIFVVADIRDAWGNKENLNIPQGDWVDEPW
ncbi:MAG: cyanophycin synthetase, partial [Anaerolineae bacterium]|nr:cyanophycin synthetase [Anaerolineae bacterium]